MKTRFFIMFLLLALLTVPALAQESTHSVTFDGFGFDFSDALAQNVNIQQVPGDPIEGAGPGFSDAAKTQFTLYNSGQPMDSLFDTGGVRVYRMADLAQYDFLQAQVEQLQTLVAERPDLSAYASGVFGEAGGLPYVPVLTHGQVAIARAEYVETEAVVGIRYMQVVRADLGPFTPRDFMYTFQGITTDGEYYIAATFLPTTTLFPEVTSVDPAVFQEQWPEYVAESIAAVNSAAPEAFTPSLDVLDAVVESFRLEGM